MESLSIQNDERIVKELQLILFEKGLNFSIQEIMFFLGAAQARCLKRLKYAAIHEGLISNSKPNTSVNEFLLMLESESIQTNPQSKNYQWKKIRLELAESMVNDALAQAYSSAWRIKLQHQSKHHASFWDWLSFNLTANEGMQLLEQWGASGHPHHPNFRAKMGFTRRDVLNYSPEFESKIRLHWCALHKNLAFSAEPFSHYHTLLAQDFHDEYASWQNGLLLENKNPSDYLPLPVHPWQWRNILIKSFGDLIDKKDLILIPHLQRVKPSMSFRTLMPSKGSHLKLATSIHTTSALRTLSPASIYNGPQLSNWLEKILKEENHYKETIFLASDLAGVGLNHKSLQERKQLGCIIRKNPSLFAKTNEHIIPLAALFVTSPITDKPLLIEIIEKSEHPPVYYFKEYLNCLLPSQIHLLLKHGIAFEAHQQNTLLILNRQKPKGIVIRDLGNVSICQLKIYDSHLKPTFLKDSLILTECLSELADKFIHSNIQSNIAYWIELFGHFYGLSKQILWRIVKEQMLIIFQSLSSSVDKDVISIQRKNLFSSHWNLKCLLRMRLTPQPEHYIGHLIPNPLNQFNG